MIVVVVVLVSVLGSSSFILAISIQVPVTENTINGASQSSLLDVGVVHVMEYCGFQSWEMNVHWNEVLAITFSGYLSVRLSRISWRARKCNVQL